MSLKESLGAAFVFSICMTIALIDMRENITCKILSSPDTRAYTYTHRMEKCEGSKGKAVILAPNNNKKRIKTINAVELRRLMALELVNYCRRYFKSEMQTLT